MDDESKASLESGSIDIPLSSQVDPTGVMPPFDQGRAVNSMTVEEAKNEWKEMTLDTEGKYKNFPRSVFLSRRDALWERGFAEGLKNEEKTRQEESRKWLERENERIEDRDAKEALKKAERDLKSHFGGEKGAEEALKLAQGVLKRFGKPQDLAFLESTGLGNDVEMIETLAKIGKILERGGKGKK